MLLSRQSGYAIEAVLQLARSNTSRPLSSGEMAAAGNMPVRYLLAILRKLVRCGILRSRRGATGGYVLAKAASTISVLDLIEGVDGPITQIWVHPESRGQRNGSRQNSVNGSVEAFAASFAAGTEAIVVEQRDSESRLRRRDAAHSFGAEQTPSDNPLSPRQSRTSLRAFGHLTASARAFLESLKISDLAATSPRPNDVRSTGIVEVGVTPGEWASGNWVI